MSEQILSNQLLNGRVVLWQFVEDLPKAVHWYSDTFGIKSSDNIGHAYFFPINEKTTLALSVSQMNDQKIGSSNNEMLDLQCDDIYYTHRILMEKGVRLDAEVRNPAWIYHEFFLWDPDGNMIRMHGFVQDKNK
ncbi:VOC family protein [Paenibacillus ginsengarvi]|uniref:VOC family protein n=1 Tax=Paenibacillus ginsengarvi TaxID=400777 RepID=A0A3B0C3I5_9BACL|nr:VOC family protein [Paenibacillus ginsengarvi]RKN80563.1 VOC family protein [Paenibacillus ginsengarvi]